MTGLRKRVLGMAETLLEIFSLRKRAIDRVTINERRASS
jgi:hypothetical protein